MHVPVFIGCMPRSGSSLLRVMLDSHPKMSAGPEINWVGSKNPKDKLLLDINKISKIYINKEPANLSMNGISLLKELFGKKFKFIHILRHPKDVCTSYLKTIEPFEFAKSEFIKDANRYLGALISLKTIDHIEVKYESLIENPKKNLIDLCNYIGVDFNDAMMSHYKKRHKINNHHSDRNAIKPIFNKSVGQYKNYENLFDKDIKAMLDMMIV